MKKTAKLLAFGLFLTSMAIPDQGNAFDFSYAILGGHQNSPANSPVYQAIVNPDGSATLITGDVQTSGFIRAVDINSSGYGLLGGNGNFGAYAAFVSPDGVATRILGSNPPPASGQIRSVAINSNRYAILGGIDSAATEGYVALVSPSGATTAPTGFPLANSNIGAVDINDSRQAIVGGISSGQPYAALISPSGTTSVLTGPALPTGSGVINSVKINNLGYGIVGGRDFADTAPYVALVSPSGVTSALTGDAPSGGGNINSVDINDSRQAIIGGSDGGGTFYAAVVSPEGVATAISGPGVPTPNSFIFRVAINSSGAGIIGGSTGVALPFATLVSPTGETTFLTGEIPEGVGEIFSVDIADSGVAIIGGYEKAGQLDESPYQAIVAPNGTVTKLFGDVPAINPGEILGVAITGGAANFDPSSFGSGNAFANPLFALSTVVLKNHIRKPEDLGSVVEGGELSLVADATDKMYFAGKPDDPTKEKYAVWLAPFGQYAKLKEHDSFPTIRDRSIGALLGFDYDGWEQGMIGGGLAYSFQDIHYSQDAGKAKVNQELATIYGAWYGTHVTVEAALWGGLYQFRNYRKTLGFIESKSLIHGWLFAPHVSVQAPFKLSNTSFISPFVQFDWVNNWQGKVREHGSSGLNLRIGSHYASVLRSELGVRLTQYKKARYGTYKFEEGLSYVNQAPFNAKRVSAYYVGSISTFNVQLFSDRVQNLGALYLGGWFFPNNVKLPEFGLNYQGEWGTKLFSQTLSLEAIYRF